MIFSPVEDSHTPKIAMGTPCPEAGPGMQGGPDSCPKPVLLATIHLTLEIALNAAVWPHLSFTPAL
jgi:hypothetical protein